MHYRFGVGFGIYCFWRKEETEREKKRSSLTSDLGYRVPLDEIFYFSDTIHYEQEYQLVLFTSPCSCAMIIGIAQVLNQDHVHGGSGAPVGRGRMGIKL